MQPITVTSPASPSRPVKRRLIAVSLVALGGLCLPGCAKQPRPNVLLIVIDTLRADRLGCYGNERGLTPFLDSLAERSFVFRRAYAQSCWTNPSVASLLTSRYQSQHGITTFASVLAAEEVTLPELLKQAGYTTAAFSANGLLAEKLGFAQGYDHYRAVIAEPNGAPHGLAMPMRAAELNRLTLSWLDGRPKNDASPVFLYLQYMEPHVPYAPPEPMLRRAFAGREPPDPVHVTGLAYFGLFYKIEADTLRDIEGVYDAEVMSVDAELRSLFAELESRRFLDNAIVIVTADHGDEFLEHGLIGHGHDLYDEVIRVPLLVLVPGHSRRTDVADLTSLIDIAPTLLDWLGRPLPAAFEGHSFKARLDSGSTDWHGSLRRFFSPAGTEPPPAFSELTEDQGRKRWSPHQRAVIRGPHKLIAGTADEHEFFDLGADPSERNGDALSEAERLPLRQTLADFVTEHGRDGAPRPAPTLDAETRERMRALGYE